MEKNTAGYVKSFGNDSFEKRPFCKEDALILSQISYLKFDTLMPVTSEEVISLKELKESAGYENLYADFRYEKDNRHLLETMLESVRFSDIKVCFYINRIEGDAEMQFAAITFLLPGALPFIAFRGTDETIVGWQEDFNMFTDKPIAGQKLSSKYINDVASKISGDFNVGGHSKGGNLAMYSAMNCSPVVKDRINTIYSFDGPGFRPEVLKEYGYDEIKDRIVSVIPKSSLVGMLLASDENSIVVESRAFGVLQHNPYTWIIEGGYMVETKLTKQHRMWINSLNEWVLSLDKEELGDLIKVIQEALGGSGAETTIEFSSESLKYLSNVVKNSKELDEETKQLVQKSIKGFLDIAYSKVKNKITREVKKITGK
ncbi:MAG: DUF2974 domain-containing protein [Lachnospiraceae bacterium]|nr:DUF2974 domain-containing protein [Lachnospiraceae bacterium]